MTAIQSQIARLDQAIEHSRDGEYTADERLGYARARMVEVQNWLKRQEQPVPDPDRDRTDTNERRDVEALRRLGSDAV